MNLRLSTGAACLVSSLLLLGCPNGKDGGGTTTDGETSATDGAAAPTGKPWDDAKGTATISGAVKWEGEKPRAPRPIDMGKDAKCAAAHSDKVMSEKVIINDNGTLRNVLVVVKKGVEDWTFTPPTTPAMLDQRGCVYIPHVLGMQVGQDLSVKTSDPTAHNVHGFGKIAFNRSQPAGAEDIVMKMKRGQEYPPFKVKCDIHPWMSAYVAVLKHPFFAVTGDDGSFTLPKKLPAGTYTIEAWHEKYGVSEQSVTVADGETKTIEFTFKK